MSFYGNVIINDLKEFEQIYEVTIDDSNSQNGVYIFKQNGAIIGTINIPKDQVLNKVELKTFTIVDDIPEGLEYDIPYMVFYFNAENQKPIYLDVRSLNEIAGEETSTIKIEVDEHQKVTAEVKNNSITSEKIANKAITQGKIAENAITRGTIVNGAIDNNKIADGAITETKLHSKLQEKINKSVNFSYDQMNKRLKISYNQEVTQ